MDTDVVIGAGIFALTGQVAEIAGPLLPFAFPAAAGMTGFSAHSCLKMSNAYPSTLATRKMEQSRNQPPSPWLGTQPDVPRFKESNRKGKWQKTEERPVG